MALARFSAVVSGRVYREMARIEGPGELLQRRFFARALRTFEQDDGTPSAPDLRKLQLGEMLAHCFERPSAV